MGKWGIALHQCFSMPWLLPDLLKAGLEIHFLDGIFLSISDQASKPWPNRVAHVNLMDPIRMNRKLVVSCCHVL